MTNSAADRAYLPAMGRSGPLPVYDAFARVMGARPVQWRLVAQAAIAPGDRVLEIGAGTGSVLLMVAASVPSATVTGLDPDPAALAVARRRAARAGVAPRWDQGYADRLPYADESTDRVLSSFMLHHLPDDQKAAALTEARRVLAPGGSLHLVDIGGGPPRVLGRLVHLWSTHDHGPHPGIASTARVLELLTTAGFAEADVVGHGRTLAGAVTFYRAA